MGTPRTPLPATTALFGKRLRAERIRLGMTQANFAEAVGVKRSSQYLYEMGRRQPDADYLRLAADLGADLDALFGPSVTHGVTLAKAKDAFRMTEEACKAIRPDELSTQGRERLFRFFLENYQR